MYGSMSVLSTAEPVDFLFSRAHCSFAPSIWRRLLIHAFFCAVPRAFTKLGIAMAASNPMIATTIMISTSVKPDLFLFIRALLLFVHRRREPDKWRLYMNPNAFTYCHIINQRVRFSVRPGPRGPNSIAAANVLC